MDETKIKETNTEETSPKEATKEATKKATEDNSIKLDMTREEYDRVKREYLADKQKESEAMANSRGRKPRPKGFNTFFNFAKRGIMKKSLKKPDEILVFLLNLKKTIEGPLLTKIYGGNFLVIRNRVYRYNPDRVFNFGKYKAVIAREFDRELVGIDDYQEIVLRDFMSKNPGARVNIDDPVLIKALIQARLGERPKIAGAGKWVIVVLVVVGLIVGFLFLTGSGGVGGAAGATTPPTTP